MICLNGKSDFLNDARATHASRPALMGLGVRDGRIYATDGFVCHWTAAPVGMSDGAYTVTVTGGKKDLKLFAESTDVFPFPDVASIVAPAYAPDAKYKDLTGWPTLTDATCKALHKADVYAILKDTEDALVFQGFYPKDTVHQGDPTLIALNAQLVNRSLAHFDERGNRLALFTDPTRPIFLTDASGTFRAAVMPLHLAR